MKNFSLDVEGLSSDPGGVLLSIGLYEVKGLETKPNPDNMFLVNVDIQSCLDAGLKVNGDTIKWWFGQLDAARNALWEPKPMKLTTAASKLQKWYDEHKEKGEKARLKQLKIDNQQYHADLYAWNNLSRKGRKNTPKPTKPSETVEVDPRNARLGG